MEKRNSTDCCFIINLQPPLAFVSHFASSPTVVQQELNLWPLPVAHATISDGSGGLHRASSAVGNQEDGGGHDMSPSQEIKDECFFFFFLKCHCNFNTALHLSPVRIWHEHRSLFSLPHTLRTWKLR
jgi:hypothetical protein